MTDEEVFDFVNGCKVPQQIPSRNIIRLNTIRLSCIRALHRPVERRDIWRRKGKTAPTFDREKSNGQRCYQVINDCLNLKTVTASSIGSQIAPRILFGAPSEAPHRCFMHLL